MSERKWKIVIQFNINTNMTDSEIKEMVEKTLTIGGVPVTVEDDYNIDTDPEIKRLRESCLFTD